MRFRLVPKSTLDDLKGHCALCFKTCVFRSPSTRIWMKIDPYYQRRRCSPMTLHSGNIRFMRMFAGTPWRGASNKLKQQWGICSGGARVYGAQGQGSYSAPLQTSDSSETIGVARGRLKTRDYQRQKCRPLTLVSCDIKFVRIFAGVLSGGGVQRQWGDRKRRFSEILDAMSSAP